MKRLIGLAFLLAAAPLAHAGVFSITTFSTDATSGISTSNTDHYTHLVDFDGASSTPATVNGVAFTATGRTGTNYTLNDVSGVGADLAAFNGGPDTATGPGAGMANLTADFYYLTFGGGGQSEYLTLTGLTPGIVNYLRFYSVNWGPRLNSITAFDGVTTDNILYDENQTAVANGVPYEYLQYKYTPASTTLQVTFLDFTPNSFHQFGFTNEEVPEPASLGLLAVGGAALLRRRRV